MAQDDVAGDDASRDGHWFEAGGGEPAEVPDFDVRSAHIARVYDYWLGGHFLQAQTSGVGYAPSTPRPRCRRMP